MRRFRTLLTLLALLLAGAALPAWSGVRDAPGKDLQVALITYGPGAIYWERFGHDAIEIRDTVSGESVNFNYGVFDFDQKDFLLNFARGRMNYMMDAERSAPEIGWYVEQHRSVRRQMLNLSAAQAAQLRDFLLWNLRPENLHYRYDYYTSNCTTKVRDAFDRVLGGQLEKQLAARTGGQTYRQQTDRLMAAQPWLMLLLDLGLSHYADRPLNAWQESFLPVVLADQLTHARIRDAAGDRPLIASDTMLAPNGLTPPPATAPDLRLPLLAAGAALGLALLLLGRSKRRAARIGFGVLATLWLLLAGLAGLFMLALWTLTTHVAGWANANLLLFNPLAWGLFAAVWRTRASRRAHLLAWIIAALAALALLGNLTGLLMQRNLPWILLALPVWAAILHTLRRRNAA
ncbi:membrane protein [Oleiagrimonas soli]|uniref:Membrane protein n=1 Tax=Oleiagrimonas soli TaxID=1543381 RepID=A0A099CYH7_9GAMM|nr:membrane protein [Oleiagrimonas soli]